MSALNTSSGIRSIQSTWSSPLKPSDLVESGVEAQCLTASSPQSVELPWSDGEDVIGHGVPRVVDAAEEERQDGAGHGEQRAVSVLAGKRCGGAKCDVG